MMSALSVFEMSREEIEMFVTGAIAFLSLAHG